MPNIIYAQIRCLGPDLPPGQELLLPPQLISPGFVPGLSLLVAPPEDLLPGPGLLLEPPLLL